MTWVARVYVLAVWAIVLGDAVGDLRGTTAIAYVRTIVVLNRSLASLGRRVPLGVRDSSVAVVATEGLVVTFVMSSCSLHHLLDRDGVPIPSVVQRLSNHDLLPNSAIVAPAFLGSISRKEVNNWSRRSVTRVVESARSEPGFSMSVERVASV